MSMVRSSDDAGADIASGTSAVFHDDRLIPLLPQFIGYDPGENVGCASRWEWYDNSNSVIGISGCILLLCVGNADDSG